MSHWMCTLHVFLLRTAVLRKLLVCALPANGHIYTNLGEQIQHTVRFVTLRSFCTDGFPKTLSCRCGRTPAVEHDQSLPVPLTPVSRFHHQSNVGQSLGIVSFTFFDSVVGVSSARVYQQSLETGSNTTEIRISMLALDGLRLSGRAFRGIQVQCVSHNDEAA